MHKLSNSALAAIAALGIAAGAAGEPATAQQRPIVVAAGAPARDTGLLDYLVPIFTRKTGIEVKVVSPGTARAFEAGRRGEADVILLHVKFAEQRFVANGDGVKRFPVMSNDLVLVGPRGDPAGIKSTTDIVEALQMIHDKQASFISRGDRSGIHLAELALWHKDAGINIEENSGPWYQALDVGMREALEKAAATNSYLLSDRATWLYLQDKLDLQVVLQGDRRLSNQYGAVLVNPQRHPTVDAVNGQAFIDWLVSPEGQQAIAGYRIGGEQLFFPSAHDKDG